MTESTSQAVRDALIPLRNALLTWEFDLHTHSWPAAAANADAKIGRFESAVRADEAAGLVDILARALVWPLVGDGIGQFCSYCGGNDEDESGEVIDYVQHTPDCPWVEGMNAVAEAQR